MMGDGIWFDTYGDCGEDESYDYDNGRYSSEVPRRLDDRTVVAETQKAWQCSEGYWWPKSQCRRDKNGVLYVSEWIWNQKMRGPVPEKPNITEPEIK